MKERPGDEQRKGLNFRSLSSRLLTREPKTKGESGLTSGLSVFERKPTEGKSARRGTDPKRSNGESSSSDSDSDQEARKRQTTRGRSQSSPRLYGGTPMPSSPLSARPPSRGAKEEEKRSKGLWPFSPRGAALAFHPLMANKLHVHSPRWEQINCEPNG